MILNAPLSILLIVVTLVLGLASAVFLWVLWWRDVERPRSWLLWTLATAGASMEFWGIYLGWIAYIRITEGLAGVPPWTSPLTTLAVIAMANTPTFLMVQFIRHTGKAKR